jgi:SsrA-binding protein
MSHTDTGAREREKKMAENKSIKVIARNKKASHDYFILEKYECGIELFGTEVKSIRQGKINLTDAYASIDDGEVYVKGMNISPFEQGNIFNRDPLRHKRLLMHKREILKLYGQLKTQGYSLIPLSVYLKGSRVKLELGLCKGKKLYDKREDIAKRDAKRDMDRAIKSRNR